MKHMVQFTATLIIAVLALASLAAADLPRMISYQGRLTDELGNPLNTTVGITFAIYDSPIDGTRLWSEHRASVVVSNGLFTLLLGSVNPIADSIFAGSDRWLGITVGIAPAGEPEICPRTRLASVPYASHIGTVDNASGGTISGDVQINGKVIVGSADKIVESEILSPSGILTIGKQDPISGGFDPNIKVGIGTSNPERGLHIKQGENPSCAASIRLEYDNDSPGTGCPDVVPSTWDINAQGPNVFSITSPSLPQPAMTILGNGNVGIGTGFPRQELQVNGSISIYGLDGNTSLFFGQESVPVQNSRWGEWGIQYWPASLNLTGRGGLNFWRPFFPGHVNPGNGFFYIADDGMVGIGCSNPLYRLDVNGKVHAQELVIDLTTTCDFVFEEHYPLLSLKERKAMVLKQKHLPNVAPAEEMQQGAALGETVMSILQNVEEHEKYLYEYDERIERLEQLVLEQSNIIEKQNSIIERQMKATGEVK
ncbi:MAG TPA: hypothetical protein VN285_01495 [Candidatus Deferrimicrobium sp.]|nr:hypothetical protein [Candidatus Deferrimicrobium sp.]